MGNKSNIINIKNVSLNLKKLDNEICGLTDTQNKDPYIFMSKDTINLLKECASSMNFECQSMSGLVEKYNGYKVFCNNDLDLGEVELR